MVTCDLCGGEQFQKYEGFLYCTICQTQSQDYHEQEYEYKNHASNTSKSFKSKTSKKRDGQKPIDDGFWTTWEAFNYILHGMTKEIRNCGAGADVENMVFKLWVAYLKECKVAFTSKSEEKVPKLGFDFRNRDVRVLYNIDLESKHGGSTRSKYTSRATVISNSSSKKSISRQKRKMVAAEYEDYLSKSASSRNSLADETIESLGKSSLESSDESLDSGDSHLKDLRKVLGKEDFGVYMNSVHSGKGKRLSKIRVGVSHPAKNKLLALIHLALLLTRSEIQLSDLLRFIRESHLSFAKVTHFFPKEMKFPKKDFTYIEIVADRLMPTHLGQRNLVAALASFLKVKEVPTPDMAALITRYCLDLNLPEQIAKCARRILEDCGPPDTVSYGDCRRKSPEARAMSSIIIALKVFLGINDETEIFLSHLAREINKTRGDSLFVFQDWQKFIECRKTVLIKFHYPTEEQLSGNSFQSSKKFLEMLTKESKDDHRKDRFLRYPRYFINEGFLMGVKDTLNKLLKPQDVDGFDFKPSLTPQVSNLETIMRDISAKDFKLPLPENILRQDFKNCDLKFATDPKAYLNLLEENSDLFARFGINREPSQDSSAGENENLDLLLDCSSRYWIARLPEKGLYSLDEFNEIFLNKTPENFQWLIKQCSRMLEMNARDLYRELYSMEMLVRSGGRWKEPDQIGRVKKKRFE